jgi:hypothetical protein
MKDIYVVITMDCEPTKATTHASASGPPDFSLSEKAIRGYNRIAVGYGFPVTFFVHPETAMGQPQLFKELESKGACLGLHMHPWKFSLWKHGGRRYMAHFGGLTAAGQYALLSEAIALWQHALGRPPFYFRSGTFSANDQTFRVLADLGFRGGSVSAPGRVFRDIKAVWTGAEPDPHRANGCFRLLKGDLEFANMPLSADFEHLIETKPGRYQHADFRPDVDWPSRYGIEYKTIATNIITQVKKRSPTVPVLNAISHNHYDYTDPDDPACRRFKTMLDEIVSACAAANLHPIGTTLENICDRVLREPVAKEDFVYI